MRVRRYAGTAFAVVIMCSLLALVGCSSGGHPVADAGEQCAECHSGRTEYEDATPQNAMSVGMTFSVRTDEQEVYLCSVRCGDEAGEKVIPSRMRTIPASEASSITVDKSGFYALCVGDENSPTTVVVQASEDGPADVVVEL